MNGSKYPAGLMPILTGIAAFLGVCLVYFSPMVEGRRLNMHDVTQYEGMRQDIAQHKQAYGEDPQWAGRMFSGMPAYLISFDRGSTVIRNAVRAVEKLASPASLIFLAMLCFFIMTMLCGIDPWVGIIPSLAYGLSTYFLIIIGAGHITKMVAAAYAPLLVGAVWYAFHSNMWLGAGLAALFASIEIGADHAQITYYFGFILLALWINELVAAAREKALARFAAVTGALLLAGALAIGSNFIVLYSVQQHSKLTTRGGSELAQADNGGGLDLEYATGWSYGVAESLNTFIPDLMGGSSMGGFSSDGVVAKSLGRYGAEGMAGQLPAYWGEQPITNGPTYLGAVALFLAVAGLFTLGGRNKWWLLAVSAVAVMLAWGSNMMWFTRLFFDFFPGYNKFRTVSMILVIVQWSVPAMGAMFLYKVWKGGYDAQSIQRPLRHTLYLLGGTALFFLLFGGGIFDFSAPVDTSLPKDVAAAMRDERASMLRADAFRSLFFVALTWLVLWLYTSGKMKRGYALTALGVLVCADMIPVDMRYLPHSAFVPVRNTQLKPTQADMDIMADTTPGYRVANFAVSTFNDATTSYFHRSVGGYHGAKLRRYQDIIDRYLSQGDMQVYNMLNTRYTITPGEQGAPPQAGYNPGANGAAWFVDKAVYTSTPDDELSALGANDLKTTAVIDERDRAAAEKAQADACGQTQGDTIALVDYRVNRLTYRYSASSSRLAVFSEIYYKDGWSATLDGEPMDYFRADYLLRAAVLPAGDHTVEFSFRIPHFGLLSGITLASSILILLWVAAAAAITMLTRKRDGKR